MTYVVNIQNLIIAGFCVFVVGRNDEFMSSFERVLGKQEHRTERISIIIC